MALASYNGWDGATRTQRLAELRQAKAKRTAPTWVYRVPGCCICGQLHGTMWHAEAYGPTFEDYVASFKALCAHCHGMLHLRFRFPNRWRCHLLEAARGPVSFVPNIGVVFGRAQGWDDDLPPPPDYRAGPEWFHQLPTRRRQFRTAT